jgi:hypothetical protein
VSIYKSEMNRLLITAFAAASIAQAAESDQEGIAFFESRIRPALAKYCYECHSEEPGKSKGGLRVDTREALLKGGESGPAVVPRSLEKSLLFQAITSTDKDAQMPPKGKLPDSVIADFRRWIEMGAPDPRSAKTVASVPVKTAVDVEKGRAFWAYQPLKKPSPPVVAGGFEPLRFESGLHEAIDVRVRPIIAADDWRRRFFQRLVCPKRSALLDIHRRLHRH